MLTTSTTHGKQVNFTSGTYLTFWPNAVSMQFDGIMLDQNVSILY